MNYLQIRPLTDHLDDVIGIWFDHNKNHITEERVEALKDTVKLTVLGYYKVTIRR